MMKKKLRNKSSASRIVISICPTKNSMTERRKESKEIRKKEAKEEKGRKKKKKKAIGIQLLHLMV